MAATCQPDTGELDVEFSSFLTIQPAQTSQLNPWTQQREVDAYCREHGIVVQAFSPLARGDRWDEPVIAELAGKYGKTGAQLLIRYSLQKGWVPLPKSERPERMKANTEVFDFAIEDGDMEALDGLDGKKMGYFDRWSYHSFRPVVYFQPVCTSISLRFRSGEYLQWGRQEARDQHAS